MIRRAGDRPTPKISRHAAERCAEMQISTKVAKRVFRHADVVRSSLWSGGGTCYVANSDVEPNYTVVYAETDDGPLIVTVLFRTDEEYIRDGANWVAKKPA